MTASHVWLAFIITPALTVFSLFLTKRWFTGSEGSGIPQVIAALHAPLTGDDTLMRCLFGVRVIVGKIVISLLGLLGGLTIGPQRLCMVIPMMAAALIASHSSALFTPLLCEALAESNYFHMVTPPAGDFLQKKPVPPPDA